jgi:hypothetical protein
MLFKWRPEGLPKPGRFPGPAHARGKLIYVNFVSRKKFATAGIHFCYGLFTEQYSNRGPPRLQEFHPAMTVITLNTPATEAELPAALSELDAMIDRQIRAFLNGESDGNELLQGLYGDALDEPVPARLTALLRR